MVGYIFIVLMFVVLYIRFVPRKLVLTYYFQLFVLILLLFLSNYLAENSARKNYPAIFDDGIRYHIIGEIWSNEVNLVPKYSDFEKMAYEWPKYISKRGWDISKHPFGFLAPGWTILIVGNVYNLFGVDHNYVKLINIFLYQISCILFGSIISVNADISKKFLKIFMFFPMLMFYSVTFLKETWIILLIMYFLYSIVVVKSRIGLIISTVLIFFTRPPVAFILVFSYIISTINSKNIKPFVLSMLGGISVLAFIWKIKIGGFSLDYVMNNMYFGMSPRNSPELRFSNGTHFITYILSNPFSIIQPVFYGIIDVVMNPNPWNISYLTNPYSGGVGLSYYWEKIGSYLSSIGWYYYLTIMFPIVISNMRKRKFALVLQKNKLYILIYGMNILYMGFRADLRYKYAFVPIILIFGHAIYKDLTVTKEARLKYTIAFILVVIFLAIFDSFIWGRSTIGFS